MSKKSESSALLEADPTSNPFREFRDSELLPEYWGLGPMCTRPTIGKTTAVKKEQKEPKEKKQKGQTEETLEAPEVPPWVDPQIQPLPRSARRHLHGWRTPEELAAERWNISDVVIFEEPHALGGKLDIQDVQIAHAQVLLRSSFCRDVLSCCFILENAENMLVEYQSDFFSCSLGPEGWRARYHIYSPNVKPGGGIQHKPVLNKDGCYLVRLYYMGSWRCVWVSDQVPVDANDAPLLPFSPLAPVVKTKLAVSSPSCVQLWPLLLCKALLKLAAPDMDFDDLDLTEDESMTDFSIMHALTGAVVVPFYALINQEQTWVHLLKEVPQFAWDDDDQTMTSGTKSKSTKKTGKEPSTAKVASKKGAAGVHVISIESLGYHHFQQGQRGTITTVTLRDTKTLPPYYLPGVSPGHRMMLYMTMMRDVPLAKPLQEPEVPMWKTYRWVEWARSHGLYDAYACPRKRFVKIIGLMKLSYAPHLLDVMSGDSITFNFRMEHQAAGQAPPTTSAGKSKEKKQPKIPSAPALPVVSREETREWVLYEPMFDISELINFIYFPSTYEYASAFKVLPTRPEDTRTRSAKGTIQNIPKQTDMRAPGAGPLYLQVDNPTFIRLKIALSTVNPMVLVHSRIPKKENLNKCYAVLEEFEWFEDYDVPYPKGFMETRGYDAIEIGLLPGRHFFRLWVAYRLNWHVAVISDAAILMGGRNQVLAASNIECTWVANYLTALGSGFINWIRAPRPASMPANQLTAIDRDFFDCYQPDLPWNESVTGCPKVYVHSMFKKALQRVLKRELTPIEYPAACQVLRRYFHDPDFGISEKAPVQRPFREIIMTDPCDCIVPEFEEDFLSHITEEDPPQSEQHAATPPRVSIKESRVPGVFDSRTVQKLLTPPDPPAQSQVCEVAKDHLTCPIVRSERDKVIRKHEAATRVQAYWRGYAARNCLNSAESFSPEILKSVLDCTFGNLEALSRLMNELFKQFPNIRHSYSIASGLNGGSMLVQNTGVTKVTIGSKWLPFFQGTYYAHMPVKVHFDLTSNIKHTTFAIYDNDTSIQVPQAYNVHRTFHFLPNKTGYTVLGHGTLHISAQTSSDAVWTLSVLSSTAHAFHICDNEFYCKVGAITASEKFRMEEIYLPNRRNILGGVQLSVTKTDTISFKATATSPDLEMQAVLWQIEKEGPPKEIGHCNGVGEVHWPYLRLEASELLWTGQFMPSKMGHAMSARSLKAKTARQSTSNLRQHTKSSTRIHRETAREVKLYVIEVTAPKGWPLSLEQWKRVDEVRNSTILEETKEGKPSSPKKKEDKKPAPASAKERDKEREKDKADSTNKFTIFNYSLQPGDAYAELECATPRNGGVTVKKDDNRDVALYNAIKSWDYESILQPQNEPKVKRAVMGANYRKMFREENLEYSLLHPNESILNAIESNQDDLDRSDTLSQAPEFEEVHEEETKFLTMPSVLRDRFHELYFVPLVTKEFGDECVLLTEDKAEAAKAERQARMEAGFTLMDELDAFNDEHVLVRQKRRGRLVETLLVDSHLRPEIVDAYNERDEVIAAEIINILGVTRSKGKEEKKAGKGKGKAKTLI